MVLTHKFNNLYNLQRDYKGPTPIVKTVKLMYNEFIKRTPHDQPPSQKSRRTSF